MTRKRTLNPNLVAVPERIESHVPDGQVPFAVNTSVTNTTTLREDPVTFKSGTVSVTQYSTVRKYSEKRIRTEIGINLKFY